ncbi:MAG: 16S rRNA (adenine(1518)-N(6)/adenine(1519)-N(6))-dimethyltransferase RsmA [Clostridia bacterium]
MTDEITRQLLKQFHITPNRALGQNFLCDVSAIDKILAAVAHMPVLEIGPGLGALTDGLLSRGLPVAAVEIDSAMVAALSTRFAKAPNLNLIHADFLKIDMQRIVSVLGTRFVVAANLPYYATTPICARLLRSEHITSITLMLQKEAALRFTAQPGDRVYGPLTVLARYLYAVTPLFSLSPASYWPQPDVDSSVITLSRLDTPYLPELPRLLDAAFAMRRKTLLNNLKPLDISADLILSCGVDPSARAETLDVNAFVKLCTLL